MSEIMAELEIEILKNGVEQLEIDKKRLLRRIERMSISLSLIASAKSLENAKEIAKVGLGNEQAKN
jgi:hypothetical protein